MLNSDHLNTLPVLTNSVNNHFLMALAEMLGANKITVMHRFSTEHAILIDVRVHDIDHRFKVSREGRVTIVGERNRTTEILGVKLTNWSFLKYE